MVASDQYMQTMEKELTEVRQSVVKIETAMQKFLNQSSEAVRNARNKDGTDKKDTRNEKSANDLATTLKKLKEEGDKIGETLNKAAGNAFSKAGDALVNYLKTGKMDWSDVVKTLKTDLKNIAVKEAGALVAGGLMKWLGIEDGKTGKIPASGVAEANAATKPENGLKSDTLKNFFDGLTGLMQMLIFFLLGLLAFPSRLPQVVLPALLIAVFLTFVARPVAVALVLTPFKGKISQQLLVSWAGLRGAASIVFAIMAEMAVETENDVFHIVFMIVLFSILLQGSLLPLVAKKLDMIDEKGDVMKTFNDYSDEVPVQFIQLSIPKSHHWCGKTLKELTLPPETLVVLLKRNGENIIPNGDTRLLENDVLVLSATSPDHVEGVSLVEIYVDENSKYNGKLLSEIPKKENTLVIMIQRGEQVIIPHGNIRLESGDMLVVSKTEI